MSVETVVLDSSVGAKWFREEAGSERAYAAVELAGEGRIELVVPVHFVHEVLAVVKRDFGADGVVPAWAWMRDAGLKVVGLTDEVVAEAARQCSVLGCAFYDALAPAVASLLDAELITADARAHSKVPGVRLIR